MQTMAPPEDVLKERFARIDERIVEMNRRITETNLRITESREDTNRQFKNVNRRLDENTAELKIFRQEMKSLHATFQRGNYTLAATIVGAILVVLIKGG